MNMSKRVVVWLMALLFDLGVILPILVSITENHLRAIVILVAFFSTLLPLWVSGLNFRRRNWIGYGLPVLLLVVAIIFLFLTFFINQSFLTDYFATRLFPGVIELLTISVLFTGALVFSIFYTLGRYVDQWSWVVLIIVSVLFFVFFIFWIEYVLSFTGLSVVESYPEIELIPAPR